MSTTPIAVTESHTAVVGDLSVRRALPRAGRRTVGAWCFVDQMGPADVPIGVGSDVGPHPHIGLQTVTWLLEGEAVHRDSLGSEQLIRPGELNLMTAGHGIAHSEEGLGARSGRAFGVQLWVAQPEATRNGAPAFEHHDRLPRIAVGNSEATVLVGSFAGATSPARHDTDHFGVDLEVRVGRTEVALESRAEHAVVVMDGAVRIDGAVVVPGNLGFIAAGRDEIALDALVPTRLLLLGGSPFEARISMFWNFVARTHEELELAHDQWMAGDERFGVVHSPLARIASPVPPWRRREDAGDQ